MKIKKQKKVTIFHLLMKYVSIALVLSAIIGMGYRRYLNYRIAEQAEKTMNDVTLYMMKQINRSENLYDDPFEQIDAFMPMRNTTFLMLEDAFGSIEIRSDGINDSSTLIGALIDEDNNIVASNRLRLTTVIRFADEEDPKSQCFRCDDKVLDIPEIHQLYDKFYSFHNGIDYDTDDIYVEFDSLYINKKDHTFIPRKGTITLYKNIHSYKNGEFLYEHEDREPDEIYEINIDIDDPDYELLESSNDVDVHETHAYLRGFFGVPEDKWNELSSDLRYLDTNSYSMFSCDFNDQLKLELNRPVYFDGKEYTYLLRYIIDPYAPEIQRFYWFRVLGASAVLLILALMISWAENVKNRARYAFEDHQKALTNNLAHDIKTPLMAISGYAENMRISLRSGDTSKASEFASAILENVSYTDSIINRTLELNKINDLKKLRKETVNIHELTEKIIEKYALMLEEKNISVNISGDMSVWADTATMTSAIENLISNAVKYTSENGKIDIALDKRSFTVSNDISERINTKKLTEPYVTGDSARGKKSGSGLGLSIVKSAAELNGFRLSLSSTDRRFTAVLSQK